MFEPSIQFMIPLDRCINLAVTAVKNKNNGMDVFYRKQAPTLSSICSATQAVISPTQSQHLWHHLAMLFRYKLLSWSWRRPLGIPLAPVICGGSAKPTDLRHKISTNVEHVIDRINSIAPKYKSEEYAIGPPQSVHRGVTELMEAALTPRNLCMMIRLGIPGFNLMQSLVNSQSVGFG